MLFNATIIDSDFSVIFDSCRISLLDGKYQVIKPPLVDTELIPDPNLYLGKSQKGV